MDVWDRQPAEPNKAYRLFLTYLQLGPGRSLSQLATAARKSESYCRSLSARWQWIARADQWDREQSRLQLEAIKQAHLAEIAAHKERTKLIAGQQLAASERFLALAMERLNNMTGSDLADLSGAELATALKAVSVMAAQALTATGQALAIAELLTAVRETNPHLLN